MAYRKLKTETGVSAKMILSSEIIFECPTNRWTNQAGEAGALPATRPVHIRTENGTDTPTAHHIKNKKTDHSRSWKRYPFSLEFLAPQ